MTCRLFHKWGKWVDGTQDAYDHLINQPFQLSIQGKRCERCRKIKTRYL